MTITNSKTELVGERGFEPPAPASRRQCSTRLSYSPTGTRFRRDEGSRREPRPRLDRRGFRQAQPQLAPEHAEPVRWSGEFLARASGTRALGLGRFNL